MAEAIRAAYRFLRVLRQRKAYVAVAVVASCLLGALYCATATRLYEAQASLLVIPTGADMWNPTTTVDGSRQALIPTYERLFSEDVVLDGAVALLRDNPVVRVDFGDREPDKWAAVLRRNLTAKRLRRTNLIQIAYRSRNPRAAEATVSAIIRSYLDFMEKNHRDVSTDIVQILDSERSGIESQLLAKQKELLEVKHRTGDLGLTEASQAVHPAVQRVLKLNDKLIEVQQKRLDLQATMVAVKRALAAHADLRQHLVAVEPMVGRELMMNSLGLNPQYTEILGKVEQKLIEDRARLEKLLKHFGPAHPDVIEVQQVIGEAERYLAEYRRNVQQRLHRMSNEELAPMLTSMLREQLAQTQAHEDELAQQYERAEKDAIALNDRMAEASVVENEVERLRHLHDTLLNRIAGLDINQNQVDVRVTVVSDPVAENRPVSPNLLLTAICCLFGGTLLGVGTVYVLDLLDDRFQTPEEIQQQLEAPLLGMIGALSIGDQPGLASLPPSANPKSTDAEVFRTLRTALRFSGRDLDCLAVTSAEPGDGKTTVLASLGVTFALAGKRTLLVDADLRRPGLSRLLGVRGVAGLSRLLREAACVPDEAERMVQKTQLEALDVLPCGPRPTDPAEMLARPQFAEVLAWASGVYDQVLVDCPPVLATSDAAIIARQTDGALLVIQPEKNHRRLVLRAVNSLRLMQVELAGVVANRVTHAHNDSYYGLDYGDDDYGVEDEKNSDDFRIEIPDPSTQVSVRRRAA